MTRILVLLALMAITGAGCLGGGGGGSEGPADLPALDLRFADPVALPQNDYHGAEPNIAILDDGTIFIAAMSERAWTPGVDEGKAWLWRSRDNGDSWERLRGPYPSAAGDESPFLNPGFAFCSCDPDVVVSPDGWVYYTDWWTVGFGNPVGNFIVERSGDGGDTWDATPVTVPNAGNEGPYWVDRQWLLAGEDGFVALFYHQEDTAAGATTGSGFTLKMVVSRDHGETWGLPETIMEDTGSLWELAQHPLMLPDGRILVPIIGILELPQSGSLSEAPMVLRVLISADQGATWRQEDLVDLPRGVGAFWAHSAAADDAGWVLLAYNERNDNGTHLHTMESNDGGRTWTEPAGFATEGFHALPWIAGRDNGRFAIAWYSSNWTGEESEAPEDTQWYAMAAERAGPEAEWVVGRVDETPVWTGPMCFDGAGCGARPLRDYLSLEYAPDGTLHVAYTRGYVEDVYDLGQFYGTYGKVHTARSPWPR